MKRVLLFCLLIVTLAASLRGQGFADLDFESGRVIFATNPPGSIATSNAFPGWSTFAGTNQAFYVQYNYSSAPYVTGLVGSNSLVLNGNFGASMGPNETMSQAGLVPNGAESLLFDATSSSFLVSLGSQNLSYVAISNALSANGRNYAVFAADISTFAGQTETLTFFAPIGTYGLLDDIRFSPEVKGSVNSNVVFTPLC